jgi:glycerol-3-phosphate acyltransferase PlsY
MPIPVRRWIIAIAAALYLYFLLPLTAQLFYELYHLTHIDPIYWGYSGFKAAGYYLGVYEHRLLVCAAVAVAIVLVPTLINKLRNS